VDLPLDVPSPVLALGAESKGAFCIAAGRTARVSRSFGPLTDPANYRAYHAALGAALQSASRITTVVRDLHPLYLTSDLARGYRVHVESVQHHHAHVAACMAEHGVNAPVIGVCCDGAGYGPDGASWGGEVLYATPERFERAAHLQYFLLPGSDKAATECWRPAWSLVRQAYGDHVPDYVLSAFADVPVADLEFADSLLNRRFQCPRTSSMGRLFDAVAYLLGICRCNAEEAQAARALQASAESCITGRLLPTDVRTEGRVRVLDFSPAIRELLRRRQAGHDVGDLAADLHETVAAVFAGRAVEAAGCHGTSTIALTGGCLANRWLVQRLRHRLAALKLTVLEHQRTPCGDAGLPLGQAYIAAACATAT